MKYKKGDKVVITANTSGHRFLIGEIVTVTHAEDRKNEAGQSMTGTSRHTQSMWWFGTTECKPYGYETNREALSLLRRDNHELLG